MTQNEERLGRRIERLKTMKTEVETNGGNTERLAILQRRIDRLEAKLNPSA